MTAHFINNGVYCLIEFLARYFPNRVINIGYFIFIGTVIVLSLVGVVRMLRRSGGKLFSAGVPVTMPQGQAKYVLLNPPYIIFMIFSLVVTFSSLYIVWL